MDDIVHSLCKSSTSFRAPLKKAKCCFEKFYKKYQSSRSGMLLIVECLPTSGLGEQEEVRRKKKKKRTGMDEEGGWRGRGGDKEE